MSLAWTTTGFINHIVLQNRLSVPDYSIILVSNLTRSYLGFKLITSNMEYVYFSFMIDLFF